MSFKEAFSCPPCGNSCDGQIYDQPGKCPQCEMTLTRREATTNRTNLSSAPVKELSSAALRQIDALFAASTQTPSPGYAMGIFGNDRVLLQKGYGLANLEYAIPITSVSVFNIASLSKQFTAACLALLIQRGSVSLEDEVSKFVPAVGKYGTSIKVKHLIYMTSGIPEYHSLPHSNGLNWNLYDYFTVDMAIAVSLAQPELAYEPGTKWTYSNVNYMLLTKIVEKVSGKRFADFAKENLFAPLGMHHTQFNDDVTVVIKNRAIGYVHRTKALIEQSAKSGYFLRDDGKYVQAHRNAPHYGGSGVFTCLEDWKKWNQNFYSHQVGGKSFYELMHLRLKFQHEKANDAFGLVFGNYRGEEIIWYAGGDIGFNSYVMRFPRQELTIVCFSNLDSKGEAENKAHQAADILFEHKVVQSSAE